MVRRKALTDRNQPREFAHLDSQLRGRINALEAEQEHYIATLEELNKSYGGQEEA